MYSVTERYSENIAKNVTFTAISGTITMTDGTTLEISDRNIREGSLSINSKINSSGEFRAGGVCADELSLSLLNYGDGARSLDGAEAVLEFRLYADGGFTEYDTVPLGIFVVDGSTIKRQADTVSFKAYDRLVLFDRSTWEMTNTLYNLISAACGSCGVPFGMSQAEFEALPNGGLTVPVDTSRVQTQRDLLMYAGVLTNSFAKINRAGELVFIQLTCTQDDHGMVVPVRELQGNIRFSTEFSDSTARVTAFIMNRNGARLYSRNRISSPGSDCLTLEWAENPLLSGMKDSEVRNVLTTAVSAIYHCINRAYKAEFSGDPALDIGDYVRLRGGQIDTKRGYGTGMITSQTWRYRGKHTIQCSMPTTVAASAAVTAALSDDDSSNRVQPKSQTEKRLDSLEKRLAGISSTTSVLVDYKYLTDLSAQCNGITYTAEKDAATGLISKISDSNGNSLEPEISAGITDTALHNAVFWAVAMVRGINVTADSVLFTGLSGQWHFGGGLTGFTQRGPESQTYSGVDKGNYSSGITVLRLSKSYGLTNSMDGYTSAVIAQSNEKIDLTKYNKLRLQAVLYRNLSSLSGAVYFCTGTPPTVQSGEAYDFSGWNKLGDCDIVTQNYVAPGTPTWYEVDISQLSGEQYLNLGVSHSDDNIAYTTYLDVNQIVLSTT